MGEAYVLELRGMWRDKIAFADGRVLLTPWQPNQIQNDAAVIGAALARRFFETVGNDDFLGIAYLAVGTGHVSWDSTPPTKSRAAHQIQTEIFRKAISPTDMAFLDDTLDLEDEDYEEIVSVSPTRRIKISAVLQSGDANGSLREFGLVAGEATVTANSGLLFNWVSHPRVDKDASMTLTREIVLTFLLPS